MSSIEETKDFIATLEKLTNYEEFKGILNVEQVAECIDASNQNAKELLDDANLLYENKKI